MWRDLRDRQSPCGDPAWDTLFLQGSPYLAGTAGLFPKKVRVAAAYVDNKVDSVKVAGCQFHQCVVFSIVRWCFEGKYHRKTCCPG